MAGIEENISYRLDGRKVVKVVKARFHWGCLKVRIPASWLTWYKRRAARFRFKLWRRGIVQ